MIKGFPSHPKASGQLDILLVSASVPQSRQKNVVSGRVVGKAGLSALGSFIFFFFAKVQMVRGHPRDMG